MGANAIAELLDQDELIRDERANLTRMKEELQEKLKQAEIEHSLERARLARERKQMEEKLRLYEQEKSQIVDAPVRGEPEKAKQSRRWLTRLGLKEE